MNVYATVVGGCTATYVSAPITTGRRFAKWRSDMSEEILGDSEKYRELHKQAVIAPNIAAVTELVSRLRRLGAAPVIDPTRLDDIEGWAQDDYREFWAAVIERYADRIVFADGWQFSEGCIYEFFTARRLARITLDQTLKVIDLAAGIELIDGAIVVMRGLALDLTFISSMRERLDALRGEPAAP